MCVLIVYYLLMLSGPTCVCVCVNSVLSADVSMTCVCVCVVYYLLMLP